MSQRTDSRIDCIPLRETSNKKKLAHRTGTLGDLLTIFYNNLTVWCTRRLGSAVVNLSETSLSFFEGDVSRDTFSLLNDEINTFASTSKTIMTIMDELSAVHPFIKGKTQSSPL